MVHMLTARALNIIIFCLPRKVSYLVMLTGFILTLYFPYTSFSHDTGANIINGFISGAPVHQYLAKEAGKVWIPLHFEIFSHLMKSPGSALDVSCFVDYDPGYDDIITASGDEDQEWSPGCLLRVTYERGYLEHFWDPDEPNFGGSAAYNKGFGDDSIVWVLTTVNQFASSYNKAQFLWDAKVICYYRGYDKNGNSCPIDKNQSYYWLGRVVHLLQDLAVPAHTHNVPHNWASGIVLWTTTDPFEDYVGDMFPAFKGDNYKNQGPYKYEDLPGLSLQQGFQWTNVHPDPTNLFKLFWYTAQKTQYYATGGTVLARGGNGWYVKLDGQPVLFEPSLWQVDGKTPVGNPADVPSKLPQMASELVPHALRAVAGLYRLFWLETNIDQQAQQDMINQAKLDPRFGHAIPGTFGKQLDWDPKSVHTRLVHSRSDLWLLLCADCLDRDGDRRLIVEV